MPFIIDEGLKLTETVAILKHLSRKYKPELLGETIKEQGQADMIWGIIQDLTTSLVTPCFTTGDKEEIKQIAKTKLPAIMAFKGQKSYLVGEKPTYPDFQLWELINMTAFVFGGLDNLFSEIKGLKSYFENMDEQERIKSFRMSSRWVEAPFLPPFAKINNI